MNILWHVNYNLIFKKANGPQKIDSLLSVTGCLLGGESIQIMAKISDLKIHRYFLTKLFADIH